jgi:LysM repeat protein/plastocyanin
METRHLFPTNRLLVLTALVILVVTLAPSPILAAPSGQQTQPQGAFVYYVQFGDTVQTIAQKYNTTIQSLLATNGLMSYSIYVGQKMVIPANTPTPTGFTCSYTVQYRDTLYSIAYRYQTDWYSLMRANNLYSPLIFTNQQLNVPCRTPEPAKFQTYVVKAGDNLFRIAIQFSTSVYAIAVVNHIPNPNWIFVGKTLVIPYPNSVVWPTFIPTPSPASSSSASSTSSASSSSSSSSSSSIGTTTSVIMQNIGFMPNTLTIQRGTTVVWTNLDPGPHTVTSGTPGNPDGLFDSGQKQTGQTFSFKFDNAGQYHYYCQINGNQMTGLITVQ